jgi:BMFP domain-containing protein YqiC
MQRKLDELEARIKELEAQKRQILTLKKERAPDVQSRA